MLTAIQAAAELGVSVRRIRAMCQSGRLPAIRFGERNWLIPSVEPARIRVKGRPKSKDSTIIPVPEPIEIKRLTTTRKKTSKKVA